MSALRILFVCLGNICRSPMAEGVFRNLVEEKGLADRFVIDSAGTGAWHVGHPPDERAQLLLKQKGIDISGLRARKVRVEDFYEFDFIFAMDSSNFQNLDNLKPYDASADLSMMLAHMRGGSVRDVPDPYYGGQDGFEEVYDLVTAASEGFLESVLERKDHK